MTTQLMNYKKKQYLREERIDFERNERRRRGGFVGAYQRYFNLILFRFKHSEPEPVRLTTEELFMKWFSTRYTKVDDSYNTPIKNLIDHIRSDKTNIELSRYRRLFSAGVVRYTLKRCNIMNDNKNIYGWSKN